MRLSRNINLTVTLVLVAAIACGMLVTARKAIPVHLAEAMSQPDDPRQYGQAWFWIERPSKGNAKLVRATRSGVETIASAEAVAGYDVDTDRVVWSCRDGGKWSVLVAESGGHGRTIWTGSEPAGRPIFGGGRVVWTVTKPGILKTEIPMPGLGSTTRVLSAAADGRVTELCSMPETEARAIGVNGEHVYLSALRTGPPHAVALYSVPVTGGAAVRFAGEEGEHPAVLRSDGTAFWSAPSRDSSNTGSVACIRSAAPGGVISTNADWLQPHGRLFAVGPDIWYIDGGSFPAAWRITANTELPLAVGPPKGFDSVAVGDREILLRRRGDPDRAQGLFVVPR